MTEATDVATRHSPCWGVCRIATFHRLTAQHAHVMKMRDQTRELEPVQSFSGYLCPLCECHSKSCGAHKFWQFWSFNMYGWYIAFGSWPISSFQLISMPKRKGWMLTRVKKTKDWSFPYSDKADSSSRSSLDVHSGNHRSVITTWWFPTMGAPQ
jgi:hypothetical protein